MKDFFQIFNRVAGKSYTAVSTNDKELRDLSSQNRNRTGDLDTSALEANLAECEGLNARFSDDSDFQDRQDAIVHRLFRVSRKRTKAHLCRNSFTYLLLGFISLAVALFILIAKPYDVLFKLKVVLSEGGEIYEMWRKPEVELYVNVYLFNVTNADDFMAGKAKKLNLKEVGPYVYRENLEHTNITFNENNTLTSVPVHPLQWIPELSGGRSEEDVLYLPNIALLSIANVVAKESFFIRIGLNGLVTTLGQTPLVQMTAKEFMFGYESSLVTLGNSFIPDWIHFDKLGLIDRMYDFEGDFETIFTGADNVSIAGLIDTYRGSKDLPQWEGEHCSNVQYASDGTKFKGHLETGDQLLFYRKSLCRAVPLIPEKEGTSGGMRAFRYIFPENMLDNGLYDERNKCFCRKGHCLPPGLVDVTDCYYGFPISLSYPHFYKGDNVLFKDVNGLKPSKEKHESSFWVQPESGLPLEVSIRMQINMALEDLTPVSKAAKFSNMHLPLLWFEFKMFNLPKSMEDRFKLYLNVLPVVERSAMYIMLIIGLLIILVTVYRIAYIIMFRTTDKKHKNIILTSDIFNSKDITRNDDIYAPCEIPLKKKGRDSSSDDEFYLEKRRTFIKTQSERFIDLSAKLGDKVTDSVSSVKERIKPHIKSIFIAKNESESNPQLNSGYKSDSDDERRGIGAKLDVEKGDFDIEVLDDGSQFDEELNMMNLLNRRDSNWVETDRILDLDDDSVS